MSRASVNDAEKAVRAAERRKLPVPEDVYEARRLQTAVLDTARTPDPERPALPATAAEAAAVIRQHAEELRLADVTRRAADLFTEEADQRFISATKDAVPKWIGGLVAEFTTLVGVVAKAAAKLPDDPSLIEASRLDWNNPVHSTAYTKAEGAAALLEQLVNDRADIVSVAGGDGGRDNALFAVAHFPQPTVQAVMNGDWQSMAPVLHDWRDLRQQPVARWVYLVRQDQLTLSLATPGEVRERSSQVELWRNAGHAHRSALSPRTAEAYVAQALSA
ncbi:hypothetical protein [Streptomyces sp. NBC_01264]|uniref:hypothetical protein n=1 Tax=Streptomyces sp. NBC_01264 TaxID=2903804 RepID=UPI0022589754|nr:hypothetical protein [Streptomyces sp. NBC_01264]MCX4780908.1 hypothetical protein [Streptomyces sp. NBC_01264]